MFHQKKFLLVLWLLLVSFSPNLAAEVAFSSPASLQLPTPLSESDVKRYKEIFALQHEAKWDRADALIAQLDNKLLLGRVLAQRYLHPTGWRSSYKELSGWLALYNDHPSASRLNWLAKKRKPAAAKAPTKPKKGYLDGYGKSPQGYYTRIPATTKNRISPSKTRSIARTIRRNILSGYPTGGLNQLTEGNIRYLTKYEEAVLRADIAHGYFIYGKAGAAVAQAKRAIALAGRAVPQAYWTAGISAWRLGDVDLAMNFLRILAETKNAPSAYISGAGFWASRGALRRGEVEESFKYLQIAAKEQDTFYGVLASEALGLELELDLDLPPLRDSYLDWLSSQAGGQRVFGLLQVGETYHASRELRYLWESMTKEQQEQTMVLATKTHMAGLAFRTADIIKVESGKTWYAGLYPLPDFATKEPLRVDRALLLAVMRQESGFNPRARSSAKASGLMQILPSTAAFISRDRRYRGSKKHELLIPEINIGLSEDYILHLLEVNGVEGDLVRLLTAYNGGPGNLRKWMSKVNHGDDALMLLESLPARETRFYVKNVITNFWIYKRQFGEETEAVGIIASGLDKDYTLAGNHRCVLLRLSEQCF